MVAGVCEFSVLRITTGQSEKKREHEMHLVNCGSFKAIEWELIKGPHGGGQALGVLIP
jgi:hypothetical protein